MKSVRAYTLNDKIINIIHLYVYYINIILDSRKYKYYIIQFTITT
jgi:hypothetical protein